MFGGGCLGLFFGVVLGAVAGHYFTRVEAWEQRELYGFFALAQRLRGMGLGALIGGLGGAVGGAWLGMPTGRNSDKPPPA